MLPVLSLPLYLFESANLGTVFRPNGMPHNIKVKNNTRGLKPGHALLEKEDKDGWLKTLKY